MTTLRKGMQAYTCHILQHHHRKPPPSHDSSTCSTWPRATKAQGIVADHALASCWNRKQTQTHGKYVSWVQTKYLKKQLAVTTSCPVGSLVVCLTYIKLLRACGPPLTAMFPAGTPLTNAFSAPSSCKVC